MSRNSAASSLPECLAERRQAERKADALEELSAFHFFCPSMRLEAQDPDILRIP